ncbi:MAG: hypothetical protein ACI4MF_06200 [Candidatus Faecivicinus sp.]
MDCARHAEAEPVQPARLCPIDRYLFDPPGLAADRPVCGPRAVSGLAVSRIQGTLRAKSAGELPDKQLDGCDAIILMAENAELEAALSELLAGSKADIPIIRTYT